MTSIPGDQRSVQPPVFFVWDNGDIQSFETAEHAEGYFCFFEDATDGGGRAWDASGNPLDLHQTDDGRLRLTASARPNEAQQLRGLLLQSLTQSGAQISPDAPFDAVVDAGAERYTMRSGALPCVLVLGPMLVVASLIGAGLYFLLTR